MSEVLTYIGYTADVWAVAAIPYVIWKSIQARKNKKLYEQLMLKIFAQDGRQIYSSISRKTQSKPTWYIGGTGGKVLKPMQDFLINNTQIIPLLNTPLQQKYNQILNTFNNVNEWINYPVLAKDALSFLSDVSIYVSKETSKGGTYSID